MDIDASEKTKTVRIDVPEWVKREFKSAAAADGNDMAEELAALVRFRDRNTSEFRRANLTRPRRER